MGIKNLSKLISDHAASAVRSQEMKSYFGRKIAIDASMCIYQFMIAVRSSGEDGAMSQQLMNDKGEVTSHLMGMFYRTIRIVTNGIKPVYVFDGKPPALKSGELAKRTAAREKATEELKKAEAEENVEDMDKFNRRLTRVTKHENDECKHLLKLMGVPFVEAPGEAEAQCAALCKAGLVYAVGTEDMDALTFGSPKLVRHMTFAESRKMPIAEFDLQTALTELELTYEQFIDLCILCGCDYTNTIKGIGPQNALKLIKKHKDIEQVLENIDQTKNPVPEEFFYKESRDLFKTPEITDPSEVKLEWKDPDEEGLIEYLVNQKGFDLNRVKNSIEKLKGAKATSSQTRLENFFGATTLVKRKQPEKDEKKGGASKKAKTAGGGKASASSSSSSKKK